MIPSDGMSDITEENGNATIHATVMKAQQPTAFGITLQVPVFAWTNEELQTHIIQQGIDAVHTNARRDGLTLVTAPTVSYTQGFYIEGDDEDAYEVGCDITDPLCTGVHVLIDAMAVK